MDRKSGHKYVLTGWVLVLGLYANAQNLVPNPSFEENSGCPYNGGQVWKAEPWYNALGGCDYFHECGKNGFGIPVNAGGGYARTGQAVQT